MEKNTEGLVAIGKMILSFARVDRVTLYESLLTDEAQFVKAVDKVMTKLTHRINHGAYLRNENVSKEETLLHYGSQTRAIEEKYGEKFPELVEILKKLTNDIIQETYTN